MEDRFIPVMEEANPQSKIQLPLDEDYCISMDVLDNLFPGAHALKYKRPQSDEWFGVGLVNRQILIGKTNFMKNYVYVVHRPPGEHLNKYLVG